MLELVWPVHTGITVFDYWFLAHATFWFFAGTSIAAVVDQGQNPFWKYSFPLVSSIFTAVMWEVFERIAEKSWPGIWQSPESGANQLVDVLICPSMLLVAWWGYAKCRPK